MDEKNGGQAFPSPGVVLPGGNQQGACYGMTLRDWFAGRAMQGFMLGLAEHLVSDADASRVRMAIGNTARLSYVIADAMLKERSPDV